MKKEEIKEHLEKGYVRIRVMFEVLGSPKEHVEGALREYLKQIKAESQIKIVSEEYADAVEKDKLWSTFCEADLLVLGLEKISWLAVNFTPASVEILEPSTLLFRNKDITAWTNDMLSRLHEIGIVTKTLNQKNKMLERNLSMMARNCILALLVKEMSSKELGKLLGLADENVQAFLNAMESEGKLIKKGKKYVKKNGKE